MREISFEQIENLVAELSVKANKELSDGLCKTIMCAKEREPEGLSKNIMSDICKNLDAAKELDIPICQDTGMAVVFVELGQDVHITGGLLADAINAGVKKGYTEGYLRKSIVADPLRRVNTGDNTPAAIHLTTVLGDQIKISVCPKGFGSENMSSLKMMTPAASEQDIIDFVVESVKKAGSNPCPPIVLGVGIGGDFETCALLAKKALCRDVSERNHDDFYKDLEEKMLSAVNALHIGPQGFGGETTALAVNIEYAPTHIAGLPVAVNVGCHVTRHAEGVL
ncbi:MAG: fumarate hydratase [Clostridia bacterium]|nr:fumarate hydratase [Clostridia bacterium]